MNDDRIEAWMISILLIFFGLFWLFTVVMSSIILLTTFGLWGIAPMILILVLMGVLVWAFIDTMVHTR